MKCSKRDARILEERELVWMVDESLKRCEIKLGKVIKMFKGDDGFVGSARVKIAHGKFNRLLVKFAPVLSDCVSEMKNRAVEAGATSNHKQEPFEGKN